MNAVAFIVLAALAVVAAGAAVAHPVQRLRLAALVAMLLVTAVLFAAAGAIGIAVVQAAVAALLGAGFVLALRRGPETGVLAIDPEERLTPARLLGAGVPAAALLVLLLVVFIASGSDWHTGSGAAGLVTTLHYRALFALLVVLVAAGTAGCAALVIGRVSADERALDRAAAERLRREERERRRREDREQARRGRATAVPSAPDPGA